MTEFDAFTLDNGIRCVHRYVRQPVAHIALTVGAGTRDERPDQHGVAHLVEHLMFKGTARRKAYHVNSLIENSGGELNAFTTKEETVLHATLLKAELAKGIDLLSDMAFNSTFNPVELTKEREVIVDEINSYRDSPSELIFDEFEELLFADSPLGRNILGGKRNILKIKQQHLLDYVASSYATDQIVFSASAQVSHARFNELCRNYLGQIPRNACQARRIAPAMQEHFDVTKSKNTYQTHCLLGGYAYDLSDAKRVTLAFLINMLGGPSSISKLNLQLREKHALTYGVEASYVPYSDSGLYTIYFGCDKDKLDQSLALIHSELESVKCNRLTSTILSRYKKQFIGQMTIASEGSESLMLGVAKSILVYNTFDSASEIAKKINSITPEDIMETANEILRNENINRLIYK